MVKKLNVICGLLVSLCVLIAAPALSESGRKSLAAFSLNDHLGNVINSAAYRGQVVMVNFWATWCLPCVEEFPTMQALKSTFSDQPFEILAINMGEDEARVNSFIQSLHTPINFLVLLDPAMTVAGKWRPMALPTTVLVDKTGKHAFRYTGSRDWNDTKSQQQVSRLLNE